MTDVSPRGSQLIKLRTARDSDALCLGVLGTQVFLETYATEGIRPAIAEEVLRSFSTLAMEAVLARPSVRVLVAETNGHLIGFAQVTIDATQILVTTARPAELDRLYVQERFTGAGLGGRLLRAAEEGASELGASALWLTPWIHNKRALSFYAKHDYADLGATWFEMDRERHQNRVLAKTLAA